MKPVFPVPSRYTRVTQAGEITFKSTDVLLTRSEHVSHHIRFQLNVNVR